MLNVKFNEEILKSTLVHYMQDCSPDDYFRGDALTDIMLDKKDVILLRDILTEYCGFDISDVEAYIFWKAHNIEMDANWDSIPSKVWVVEIFEDFMNRYYSEDYIYE